MHASCDEGKGHAFRCVSPFSWWFLVRFKCACNSSDYWQPSMGLIWWPRALEPYHDLCMDSGCINSHQLVPHWSPISCVCSLSRSGLGPSRAEIGFGSRLVQPKDKVVPFFKEMPIFRCVEAFPGSRVFLQNASKLWWSQRNYVFKCFCVFSCVQLGFRYLLMLRVYVVFVAFSWGKTFFVAAAFLSVTSVRSSVFSNYC